MQTNPSLLVLAVFLLSTVPLFAQDTPVGPEGTRIATEQTPAAATNADALRKATQNPVASLISVPVQNNNNFGIGNVWSVASPSDRSDVKQMTFQYFVNYNLKKGWYLSFSPVMTANWKASNGNVWTVPVGGGVGRVLRLGFQPVNVAAQFYGNAAHPQNGSNWSMRLQIAFLFPKLTKQQEKMILEQKLKQMEQQPPPKQ